MIADDVPFQVKYHCANRWHLPLTISEEPRRWVTHTWGWLFSLQGDRHKEETFIVNLAGEHIIIIQTRLHQMAHQVHLVVFLILVRIMHCVDYATMLLTALGSKASGDLIRFFPILDTFPCVADALYHKFWVCRLSAAISCVIWPVSCDENISPTECTEPWSVILPMSRSWDADVPAARHMFKVFTNLRFDSSSSRPWTTWDWMPNTRRSFLNFVKWATHAQLSQCYDIARKIPQQTVLIKTVASVCLIFQWVRSTHQMPSGRLLNWFCPSDWSTQMCIWKIAYASEPMITSVLASCQP